MDDVKISAKIEIGQETLMQTIRLYSQVIGMEFRFEKCFRLIMKKGSKETTKGVELQNQKSLRTVREKENYKCLGL